MTTYLTRVVRFNAAHRYYRETWTELENREAFGACSNPHGHGHNYVLEAMVAGVPDPTTGFAVDLGELDRVLSEEVLGRLDHQHINHALPEFGPEGKIPTTENLVAFLWEKIAPRVTGAARLVRLRLREDVDLFADFYGPGQNPMPGGGVNTVGADRSL